jgi:hypothetical protein
MAAGNGTEDRFKLLQRISRQFLLVVSERARQITQDKFNIEKTKPTRVPRAFW